MEFSHSLLVNLFHYTFKSIRPNGYYLVEKQRLLLINILFYQVLPIIFFFSFIVQVLSYIGVMQWIIMKLGWCLQSVMGTTLCESICAVANPFIGMVVSPRRLNNYSLLFYFLSIQRRVDNSFIFFSKNRTSFSVQWSSKLYRLILFFSRNLRYWSRRTSINWLARSCTL